MNRFGSRNTRFLVLAAGLGLSLLVFTCSGDEETQTEPEYGETTTQTAVIQLNGLEVLTLADVRVSDDPTEIPVKLKTDNTVTIRVNNDGGVMGDQANPSYPCWGTMKCPWKSTSTQDSTYTYTFATEADGDSILMGRLIVTPNQSFLSFRIDYETGPTGPIFSGPHQFPFLCRTESAGLGQPLVDNGDGNAGTGIPVYREDEQGDKTGEIIGYSKDCSMITRVDYFYKSTADDAFHRLDTTQDLPADVAQTTTSEGLTADYVVRLERGTINRFIYGIAMLVPVTEWAGPGWDLTAWNGKLVYKFQGGVGIGRQQGSGWATNMINDDEDSGDLADGGPLYDEVLSKGYAVAFSTGNVTDTHYNLVLCEETMMMVKDHFIERYGAPEYTVGVGGSGGSIQQYAIGQSQHVIRPHSPYLLDAGIPQYSYSDMITQSIYVGDCSLLEYYFEVVAPAQGDTTFGGIRIIKLGRFRLPIGWLGSVLPRTWIEGMSSSDTEKHPIWGELGYTGSTECINGWLGLTPLVMNPLWTNTEGLDQLPPDVVADVKWTHWNDLENIYGVNENGLAPRTWDNVGVQYGLQAFKDGKITMEQFLDINAKIGGWKQLDQMVPESVIFDGDFVPSDFDPWSARNANLNLNAKGVAPRSEGDIGAMHAAYASGHVFIGKIDIPLIDARHFLDPVLNMHHAQQSFATRQRMIDGQGHADNQIIWFVEPRPSEPYYDNTMEVFELLDEWLTNIKNNPELSVVENKPAAAVDKCFDQDGNVIAQGPDVWDGILNDEPEGACTQAFPLYSTSRIVAGGNIKGDVFKCHLQTVDEAVAAGVYEGVTLTQQNITRLKEIFPDGVCDYTKGDAGRPPGW